MEAATRVRGARQPGVVGSEDRTAVDPVPRRAPRPVAVRAAGARGQGRATRRRTRRDRRDGRSAAHDQGVLPRAVPVGVGRFGRGGQLGQPRARRRARPATKNPNDGTHAW